MHIAWLGKKSPFCGNVTYSREVTNGLLDRGHQVSFFHFTSEESAQESLTHTLQSPEAWPDCPQVSLPCLYKSTIYTIPTFSSSKVLARSLQALQPDLVHASLTLSPLDFLLPEICQDLDLPLIATFHPPFDRKLRHFSSGTQQLTYQLYAPCLANYHKTIVFSHIQRDILIKLGVPSSQVVVIPNGVDVLKYSPGPSLIKQELQAERLFLYQGRIALEKNVESLLKAWKWSNLGPTCKLAIVGTGPLATVLKASYGQEYGIIWLGFIGDEQRRIEILRGTDAFILPSFVEGLSLSLLEAMACGTACLATDVGADGEVLEDGAGVILKANRVTTELQALLPLFREHPELSLILGQKARQRVLERYTLKQNISQVEQLYMEVLQGQWVSLTGV